MLEKELIIFNTLILTVQFIREFRLKIPTGFVVLVDSKFVDLKNKAKTKASAIRRSQQATGGGPQSSQRMTDFEERMVAFLTEEAVHGLEGTAGLILDSEEIIPENFPMASLAEPVAGPSTDYLPIAGFSSQNPTSFEVIAGSSSATDLEGLTLVKEYVISEVSRT